MIFSSKFWKSDAVFIGERPSSSVLASDQDPEITAPGANPERDLPLGGGLSPFNNHPVTTAFYTGYPDQRGFVSLGGRRGWGAASKTEVGKHLVEQM